MRNSRRFLVGSVAAVAAVGLSGGAALAHECVNASKQNQAAGVQITFGMDDSVVYISHGLQSRIDRGLVDLETGEGFHGLIGFDMDGDGVADLSTWIVGPEGEIPMQAQMNGPACRGVTNIGVYFEQCVTM